MISRLDTIKDWAALAIAANYCAANLALCCNVSGRQLQRFFVLKMGMTPQTWLDTLRQSKAMDLLGAAKSVKEIAFELGYKQPSHFSREFKRVHGVCPKTARVSVGSTDVAAGRKEVSINTKFALDENRNDALIMLRLDARPIDRSISVHDTRSVTSDQT